MDKFEFHWAITMYITFFGINTQGNNFLCHFQRIKTDISIIIQHSSVRITPAVNQKEPARYLKYEHTILKTYIFGHTARATKASQIQSSLQINAGRSHIDHNRLHRHPLLWSGTTGILWWDTPQNTRRDLHVWLSYFGQFNDCLRLFYLS